MTEEPANDALMTFVKARERLITVAIRIVQSRAVAEELVQDSWLRWHERQYPVKKALPILSLIVANLARDWTRRRRVEHEITAYINAETTAPCTERVVIAREDLKRVVIALETLPARTVTAFRMHCVDGLTYADIGKQLRLSRSRAYELVEDALVHLTLSLDD